MRAIRGAICAAENTRDAICAATQTLLREIVERNRLGRSAIVSVFFTMTPDLDADYPAYAARDMGWGDVPMLGAVETPVPGALTRVIRILMLAEGTGSARHVYLGRAGQMRPELTERGDAERWNGPAPQADAGAPASLGHLLVVGLGLVGGSLAAAARRSGLFARVLGTDLNPKVAARAAARGLVDAAVTQEGGMREADLLVLAAPLRALPELVRLAGRRARRGSRGEPGAVITDVGSLKGPVIRVMDRLPAGVRAVGGHPMAGSERAGVESANPRLFEGAPWALVRTRRTDEDALGRVRRMVVALGARPVVLDAAEHDRAVTFTSHLPALVAAAVALTVGRAAERHAAIETLVGPGLRSATRLAAASPVLTADLLSGSLATLTDAVDAFTAALREVAAAVPRREALEAAATQARELRRRLVSGRSEE